MVLVQNKYKNTFVGVRRTQITFVTHSSPSYYVTLRTQVIRLNSGNLGPQKTDSGVLIIMSIERNVNAFLKTYNFVICLFVKSTLAIKLIGTYNLVPYIIENNTYIKFKIFVVVTGWVFTDIK